MTRSTFGREQLTSPSAPTPLYVGSNNSPRSLPITSATANAPRSARSSAGVPIRRSAIPRPRDQSAGSAGSHTRRVVATYGHPPRVLEIVALVQADYAPDAWFNALWSRIDGCTDEFIAALVSAMREDLGLTQLHG